jgi:K+-sensing histidine kinase KdpD
MTDSPARRAPPRVIVIADVESNVQQLIARVLKPAGIQAWADSAQAPPPDVILVDVTQLRGDPLAGLRARRETGEAAPAILMAAHVPSNMLRDLFHLRVADILAKPYKPDDLTRAVYELAEERAVATNTQILAGKVETLKEQIRRRSEEVRQLSEIGRAVAGLEDLDPILARVVEAAAFMCDAEEANIYLVEPGSNELVLRASKAAGDKEATMTRVRVEDTLVGEVFTTGQPMIRQPQLEGGATKVQTGFLVQSLVEVPLRVGNKTVGVLGVYNRLAPRSFNEHHQTLLMALGDWAGVALEHASLVKKTRTASLASTAEQTSTGPRGTGPVSIAPAGLIDGLKKAQADLEKILAGPTGSFANGQRQALLHLKQELQKLGAARVGVMDKQQAEALVDIPEMLRSLASQTEPVAAKRGVALESRKIEMPLLHGEKARIRQVLEALIAASLRRSEKGRIVLDATRFTVADGQTQGLSLPFGVQPADGAWVAISVADNGTPLTSDILTALTAPEVDPAAGALGYGLSMGEIRMIVESMGGLMWYEQSAGGTRVSFAISAL